jgi:myo-inositol-1(or 4)-monophosphatase
MILELKDDFSLLKSKIQQIFADDYRRLKNNESYKERKQDKSWVTEIDHLISKLVVDHFEAKGIHVLSEEADEKILKYPCVIVDPVDGTRELVNEVPEFCLSLAYMNSKDFSDPKNVSWLYNPVTGFEIFSWDMQKRHESFISENHLRGFVSRNGFTPKISETLLQHDIFVSPFGSIALKIGMLAIGACDFVYSVREKSAWDVAAGTHLISLAGLVCYADGKLLTSIDEITVDGPLLWAREEHIDKLKEVLCRRDGK